MRSAILMLGGAILAHGGDEPLSGKSIAARLADRSFPSVFQAWNPADNLKGEEPLDSASRHDLLFNGPEFFKLIWDHENQGLATAFTAASIRKGRELRTALLQRNPNMILIMEIRYRDAWGDTPPANCPEEYKEHWRGFLPADHKWWKRGADGKIVKGWEEGGFLQLDFANPEYREQVAMQCATAVKSGVVDGVMLDWYPFWERRLGMAAASAVTRVDGAMTREFTHGTAAYNPMEGKAITGAELGKSGIVPSCSNALEACVILISSEDQRQ